jgi:hypothetical protein
MLNSFQCSMKRLITSCVTPFGALNINLHSTVPNSMRNYITVPINRRPACSIQVSEKQTELQSASPRNSNRAIEFRIVLSMPLLSWDWQVTYLLTSCELTGLSFPDAQHQSSSSLDGAQTLSIFQTSPAMVTT